MAADAHLSHHFASLSRQAHATRLGMWLFLAGELLLFGALFIAYATFRRVYGPSFVIASHHLDKLLGTVDTVVLITSSFSMVTALTYCRSGRRRRAVLALVVTALLGFAFLVVHAHEYVHDISSGALPGRFFRVAAMPRPGAPMFFTLYYFMTGLHSIHVLVGVLLLVWLAVRTYRGDFDGEYDTPLELGGLYWHLVDLIWIFLYPLFYLV